MSVFHLCGVRECGVCDVREFLLCVLYALYVPYVPYVLCVPYVHHDALCALHVRVRVRSRVLLTGVRGAVSTQDAHILLLSTAGNTGTRVYVREQENAAEKQLC